MSKDSTVVHIGENSAEHVAYRLTFDVLKNEKHESWSRDLILDTYAECFSAVTGQRTPKR